MYEEILADAGWWCAVPLWRRRGVAYNDDEQVARGAARLNAWNRGILFPAKASATERWRALGVTDLELTHLLGETSTALAARLAPPQFLDVVGQAWRQYGQTRLPIHLEVPLTPGDGEKRGLGFAEVARPLITWAQQTLRDRVAGLPEDHPIFAIGLDRILTMVSRTAVLELNIARLEGRLTGNTSEERFASFLKQLADPVAALRLLAEYPVLARELVAYLTQWVEARTELAYRLRQDLPELCRTFGVEAAGLDGVSHIAFGAGDSHHGGRSVCIVSFGNGSRVVYKPRPVRVESRYQQLLAWLNERGLELEFRVLTVLDRGDYGWVEHVAAAHCADEAQLRRLFWRQGAFLATFYATCASDMHLENLIACGEHPVYVDFEATLQTEPRFTDDVLSQLLGGTPQAIRSTVLGTGVLPQRLIELDENGWRDTEISGIAGGDNQLSPNLVLGFTEPGRDMMHAVRQRVSMPPTDNLARLDSGPVDPRQYQRHMIDGFEFTYRLIVRHRADLLSQGGPLAAFSGCTTRYVPRPTQEYGKILAESFHPDVLRDSLDREFLFEAALGSGHRAVPQRLRLIGAEARQLAQQDIPSFSMRTDGTDLHDDDGLIIADFFSCNGLRTAEAKIMRMSEDDLRQQRWCIDAALVGLTTGTWHTAPVEERVELPRDGIDIGLAVCAATAIGDQLLNSALPGTGDQVPHWLALTMVGERYWMVGPTGIGLYEGFSGIALFLEHLAELSGQERFRTVAQRLAHQLSRSLGNYRELWEHGAPMSIGGFGEAPGAIYALSHLSARWNAPELLDPAMSVLPELARRFEDDKALDIILGTAGSLLSLLAMQAVRPDERIVETMRVGEAVLAARASGQAVGVAWSTGADADQPLLGFSHGASGFAYALAEAATVTGTDRNYELCVHALRFERQHLSTQLGNWPDLRSSTAEGTFLNAWCHGAAGIGLARAGLWGRPELALVQELIEEDLDIAIGTVERDLKRDSGLASVGSDCLCHGDLGLVDTLYAGASVLAAPDLAVLGRQVAKTVAERVLRGQARPGVPSWVHTPGLMLGTAGIGYGLLRAAAPDRVPSVLTLAAATDPARRVAGTSVV